MKPDWDKLMKQYQGNTKTLVGDVDCTAAGKPLCDSNGVKGFPTIKYGDPAALEAYEGGRDFAALSTFAAGLKPTCSIANMDLCDEDQKVEMNKLLALSMDELDTRIAAADKKAADAEATFASELEILQANYKKISAEKDATLAEVKASGVGTLKAVRAFKNSGGKHEEL